MRIKIPWWAKIGAKLVLSRLPLKYNVWRRLGLFRHGDMDVGEYAIQVFRTHCERAELTGKLQNKTVVELGPGDSLASAVIASAHGAQTVLVDSGYFARSDVVPYLELASTLREIGLDPPNLSGCTNVCDVLARCSATYLTHGLKSLDEIRTNSVDFIFSQAVLEHIRKREFLDSMRGCRRILRDDGICSHQVDLRDHLDGRLNNLRFSERIWESDVLAGSGFYTNRIRYSEMIRLFIQAGFNVQVTDIRKWKYLPIAKKRFAREYQEIPDSELCVSGFHVLLRRSDL